MTTHLLARLLRPVRAGIGMAAWNHTATSSAPEIITISSNAFGEGAPIPQRNAGSGVGGNISPHLTWSGVPDDAVELVLVIEDPDVPLPRPIVHGLVSGIDPQVNDLPEGALTLDSNSANDLTAPPLPMHIGLGTFKRPGYAGPRPIPGHGPHRYIFQIFALDAASGLREDATLAKTLRAIDGHVIARGKLTGTYERS